VPGDRAELLHPRPGRASWCLTRDVDPHYAGIGASAVGMADVLALVDRDVVPTDPTEEPLHHV
jgi:hypothetical protein